MNAALLVAAFLAAAPPPATDWVRVETRNFIVYGETGERRLREVASEFERFREALARVIPGAAQPSAVPTVVMVFGSPKSFEAYKPRFNGKPARLDGCFFSSEDMNIIALVDGDRAESLRTILHEYVHLVISNMMPGLPLWLNEGLAEYYSTFEVQDSGRRATLGRVIPSHLSLLNQRRLLTIDELLGVDSYSSVYDESDRQSLFYAQSWALVHMLVAGLENRSSQLGAYVKLVAAGSPSLDAWQQVFGGENVIRQLDRYIAQDVMKGVLYRFDREIPRATAEASAISVSDREAALADLLRRVAPREEASSRFERAIALEPRSSRARALYGLHALDHGDLARARTLLLEAAADRSDWLVQYHAATGLTQLAGEDANRDVELVDKAREALGRVFAARPDLPNALALSARLDAMGAGDLSRGLATVRRALAIAPGRTDYALLESFILLRRDEFTAAKSVLAPLLTPTYSTSIRESASDLMEQIARSESEAAAYRARLEGRRADHASGSSPGDAPAEGVRMVPVYRKVGDGETRVEGELQAIACVRAGVEFHVKGDAGVERFAAPELAKVELITYRDDLQGAIGCNRRSPPDRVYLTWRQEGTSRRAVAVEFLPR